MTTRRPFLAGPLALLAVLGLALSACAGAEPAASDPAATTPPGSSAPAPVTSSAAPDPATVGANELGLVPVLMYHRIVTAPAGVYDRTPADFRAELERLARERYVPVTAAELTAGELDLPTGTHPVVLTFDDGDPSQFTLTPAGEPAPDTAVAIILDVARRHPGFRPVATFFVNNDPFGDPGGTRTLPWLAAHGMEIGNHTATHANLGQSTPDQVRQEIAGADQAIRRAVPGEPPATLALPFGVRPEPAELAIQGPGYRYRGVFLVGANPAPSPYGTGFDPVAIPRIRSQGRTGPEAEVCSTVWLDKLAADPGGRYTSDGLPDRISYPRGSADQPSAAFRARGVAY